jgi:hypothetical protein
MKLRLVRDTFRSSFTLGRLYVNDQEFCNTLEDCVRAVKIKGETAIPEGVYQVVIDMSARFKRLMPHVLNVPNFEGIRIHKGNKAEDTDGCILLGMTRGDGYISQSGVAFDKFFDLLQDALKHGSVTLEVTSETGGRGVYEHAEAKG